MNKFVFTLFFVGLFFVSSAQQVHIIHANGSVIKINPGCRLMLAYKGYNGNLEYYSNIVTAITDSTIILGNKPFFMPIHPTQLLNNTKEIRYADIIAFRKRSAGGEISKSLLKTGAIIGSIIVLSNLNVRSNYTRLQAFGISFGVGLGINLALNLIFPENANKRVQEGWQFIYVP